MANPGTRKTVYRILSWGSLGGLVLTLALVFRKSPSPNIPFDPNASARVEQKFAAADQAKAAGQPAQVQLDRTELNSYLQQNLQTADSSQPSSPGAAPAAAAPSDPNAAALAALASNDQQTIDQVRSSVKDVKVDMDGDLVMAHVIFDFHGQDLSLELDGHLNSDNGYLKFEPVAGKLGSLPLPQSMLQSAVDKMMSSPENREKLKLPDDINNVKIQDGHAVVSYK
jgi:hypothetical protein